MKKNNTKGIVLGGIIAALYTVLTYFAAMLNLANGAIQVRFSEALMILPVFTPWAIPGLAIGCFLGNLLTPNVAPLDLWLGPAATLIGAVGTWLLKKCPRIAWIPPVVSNAVIIPFVLMKGYGIDNVELFGQTLYGWPILAVTVGIGEIISCGILGMLIYASLKKTNVLERI